MKLSEYVEERIGATGHSKTKILKELSAESGVSLVTLLSAAKGMPITIYPKAKSIEKATDGKVTALELCEE